MKKDIKFKKFNKLTAIEFSHRDKNGGIFWRFLCDCGHIKTIRKKHVTSGQTASCGCLRAAIKRKANDITGLRFNKLTAVCFMSRKAGRKHLWMFKCECGGLAIRAKTAVVRGLTKDCGCGLRAKRSLSATKHGMEETAFYKKWSDIKARCDNKNAKDFRYYGGRGIKYAKKWKDFCAFFEDMYPSYYKFIDQQGGEGAMITRINKAGNFEKRNCIWTQRK